MQQRVEVQADYREETGSAVSRRLRRAGKVPAVLYGHEINGVSLTLDHRTMDRLLGAEGYSGLISLKVANDKQGLDKDGPLLVLVKSHQADPITRNLTHIDFYKVNLKEEVTVSIPIHMEGMAPGVKAGGILDVIRREIEVKCLPDKIPEFVTADVSSMEMGDSLHVEDLQMPEGVQVHADTNYTIAAVVAPTKIEEPAPTEEVEAVEGAAEGGEAKPAEEKAEEKKSE